MAEDTRTSPAGDGPKTPKPWLNRLNPLVGEWRWEAFVDGQPIGRGVTEFRWIEEGAFLVEHSSAETPEFPSGRIIIGGDDANETYCMLYFDSRGIARIYQMSLSDDGVWNLWRETPGFWQRFTGRFGEVGRAIQGFWEQSEDGRAWEKDFDLIYAKLG